MGALAEPVEREPDTTARPPLARELLLVVGLFLVYKLGRQVASGHVAEAFHNADRVWSFERAVRLPDEGSVQRALLHSDSLIHIANTYYAAVHFPAMILFLAWLYWRRPPHYVWVRRVLTALTGAALALHLLVPLAPPRMLAEAHLVDTGQVYGPTVYGSAPATDSMANQYAAMPSLHFGWALMTAIGLIAATRSRARWLWLLHPLVTLLVIVGTANHYWLDSIVATALLAVALAFIRLPLPGTLPGRRAGGLRGRKGRATAAGLAADPPAVAVPGPAVLVAAPATSGVSEPPRVSEPSHDPEPSHVPGPAPDPEPYPEPARALAARGACP
ncbi:MULTISPECIES: phosphatase PAP2 family protein [unclassified Streptomyces]|uniref:phosphatase PAP2 family protein n=1 Tax=unclassified Streptomyces TaxID=2593676 RepID=UPI002E1DE6D4|nr:phosphatase PAP2 family protein [Streptomyces sp. NBC_01023]